LRRGLGTFRAGRGARTRQRAGKLLGKTFLRHHRVDAGAFGFGEQFGRREQRQRNDAQRRVAALYAAREVQPREAQIDEHHVAGGIHITRQALDEALRRAGDPGVGVEHKDAGRGGGVCHDLHSKCARQPQ
jgi:hypothetical protein